MTSIIWIYYIVVSTIGTSLMMAQISKGCESPKFAIFRTPNINMVYSVLVGWLTFVPTLLAFCVVLGRIAFTGVTWKDIWEELDGFDEDGTGAGALQ